MKFATCFEWTDTSDGNVEIKTEDGNEIVGDDFEMACLYLRLTDQPRALLKLCVYVNLLASELWGSQARSQ